MLQFITHPSDRYSIAEEVQMAIEGGCRWIQLRMKDASDEEVRQTALDIIPMCQETDTFLIIDDRVSVVNDLKVSGVHLGKDDMNPLEAREILGPHAIIGITANTAEDIIKYKGKDVDYIGLGPFHFTTTKKKLAPEPPLFFDKEKLAAELYNNLYDNLYENLKETVKREVLRELEEERKESTGKKGGFFKKR